MFFGLILKTNRMESEEAPAQRPVTLDITAEDAASDPAEPIGTLIPTTDIAPLEENINLGAEFITPQGDSSATPSESLMDKLNDQMMESVMISDSPNNSEEDDIGAIDSFLDGGDEGNAKEHIDCEEEQSEIGRNTTEIKAPAEEPLTSFPDDKADEDTEEQEHATADDGARGDEQCSPDEDSKQQPPQEPEHTSPTHKAVPVCTIFNQGTQPKSLVPDGFQPTLIKSPSFSMGSGGGNSEAVTPSKTSTPFICQPSPSLSKFFTDNGQTNPGSDFFDSFTAPSSFISVSNPNAEVSSPTSVAPAGLEQQLSSTSASSISTPGGPLDSDTPTPNSTLGPSSADSASWPQPALSQGSPAHTQPPAPAPQPQPFNQLQAVFSGSDDPFATALSLSEVDRRHDAWLPSEETKKVLISVATQQCNPSCIESSRLTMPGLKFDNLQVRLASQVCCTKLENNRFIVLKNIKTMFHRF